MRPRAALGIGIGGAALVALASALFAAYLPPREHVVAWLALVASSTAILIPAGLVLARASLHPRHYAAAVLATALLLRLGALAAPVSLSDDVHRYAWDGALLASGHDPYASRPREVAHLVGHEALSRLNSPDYYSVYPPLAQAAFAVAAFVERLSSLDATLVLRVLFVLAELAALAALLGLAPRLDVHRGAVLLYAWHPLAFWEVAAGGHTEALMLPFVVLAAAAALDERPSRAGLALGLAASAKLTALVLAPVLLVHLARRLGVRRALPFAALAGLVPLVLFAPFVSPSLPAKIGESLALYQHTFSFNAPCYYALRRIFGYREDLTASVDHLVGPLLTLATLGWLALLAHRQDGSAPRLVLGLAHAYAGYLFLSRVIHPWYLLVPLALGALAQSRALVVVALLSLASYLRYDPLGDEHPLVLLAQALALVLLAPRELRWLRAKPARAVS